jgi:uncharacterized protein YqiB (DUF1249 family)
MGFPAAARRVNAGEIMDILRGAVVLQRALKKPYKVDLAGLHSVCEANYARLKLLFPGYETSNAREFAAGDARIRIEVIERARYTTIFRIYQQHMAADWLGHLKIELRAYHDAGMLEVGKFQSHEQIKARYQYPNAKMHQQDEKAQQNAFLADWLEHCLENGRAQIDLPVPSSGT